MSDLLQKFGAIICRWLARSIETPSLYARSAWTATLSLAEVFVELLNAKLVTDIRRIKEANIKRIEAATRKAEAQADLQEAEAQLKLTEAAHAANLAALHKRQDALARAEKARLLADAANTDAEAYARRMDADTRRMQAIAEAKTRLLEALSRLRQEGGDLLVDRENLQRILRGTPPRVDNDLLEE